ncbi:MAG: EI24 domain-containing protein [Piscinibacter sp.]|nr:EI24 domain-containing protein [Piscinibacter sp.]
MGLLLDSFWRAAAYCLHPRVIALSVLPLVLMAAAAFGLGYFFWEPALDAVHEALETWPMAATVTGWIESAGGPGIRTVLAPLVVVLLATPAIVVAALLVVALLMVPAMLGLVAERRFATLEKKRGGSLLGGAALSLGATLLALLALVLSLPLWLVPPLVLVLPPLIWGWLTYRVMTYDTLAEHASADERRALVARHRPLLIGIGVLTGYLGAAPSLLWASGVLFVAMAPILVPVALWVYTLVFAFSALWFAHFLLAALAELRQEAPPPAPLPPPQVEELLPPPSGTFA